MMKQTARPHKKKLEQTGWSVMGTIISCEKGLFLQKVLKPFLIVAAEEKRHQNWRTSSGTSEPFTAGWNGLHSPPSFWEPFHVEIIFTIRCCLHEVKQIFIFKKKQKNSTRQLLRKCDLLSPQAWSHPASNTSKIWQIKGVKLNRLEHTEFLSLYQDKRLQAKPTTWPTP